MTDLKIAERPGFFGRRRDEILLNYNARYGSGNWKLLHIVGENLQWVGGDEPIKGKYFVLDFLQACRLYEESYFAYFVQHPDELEFIVANASEVFDNDVGNVQAGLDYSKQTKGIGTHIQDIAVRNVVDRLGLKFKGEGLLQIRTNKEGPGGKWSPMNIPFYKPEWILRPELEGWWTKGVPNSVELWYQSNKMLLTAK